MFKIYTLPKNYKIDFEVLNKIIEYNESYNGRLKRLGDYYLGLHDIGNRKKSKGDLYNNHLTINHAKYITDISVGYLLGNPIDYQADDSEKLKPLLREYNKQAMPDFDVNLAKNISKFGYQYEYVYTNEKSEPKSCLIDNQNAIIVYDDTVEHNKIFGLIYRKIYKGKEFSHWNIIFVDDKKIVEYNTENKVLNKVGEERTHCFGKVPLICYKNNSELLGDYEPVLSLIDAYNLLQSDRINDKEQLVDSILCIYGGDFTEEDIVKLKRTRTISRLDIDEKVEYLTKSLNENEVDVLRRNIENDIHKISMIPNMSDENFASNSSGVAIKYKLLGIEQLTKNKEQNMKKGLKERFELYNNFLNINSKMELIPKEDVDIIFKRNLPQNDYETSQMINNLADYVDKETLIAQLSFIDDAQNILEVKEKEKIEEQKNNAFLLNLINNEIPNANNYEKKEDEINE